MRVLVVDPYYPQFLDSHYAARPRLANATYDEQWRTLMERRFSTSDAYSHYLGAVGIEAHEVVPNCGPLQAAWLRENGIAPPPRALPGRVRQQEVLLEQVRRYEPDVVYLHNVRWMLEVTLRRIRKATRLLVGQNASEPPGRRKVSLLDLMVTSFPHYADELGRAGFRSVYQPLAFDPRVLDDLGETPVERDVVFVGSLHRYRQHRRGGQLLSAAAEQLPLELWGYRAESWPADSPVRRAYRGEAWGLEMLRTLRSARVSLNRHSEASHGNANNLRLYEATGVGSLLLTDEKRNLHELFEPGREVVTYRDAEDLVAQARHYLDHEDERNEIAAAGQRRTLSDHTFERRIAELATILGEATRS
jgi:spore maturation protein CgeB